MLTRDCTGWRLPAILLSTGLAVMVMGAGSDKADAATGGTTSIRSGSAAARRLNADAPAAMTKEEQQNAKPLDWNSTIGTPNERPLTAAQEKALKRLKPRTSAGGKPNPNAEAEARKLYPDEWK